MQSYIQYYVAHLLGIIINMHKISDDTQAVTSWRSENNSDLGADTYMLSTSTDLIDVFLQSDPLIGLRSCSPTCPSLLHWNQVHNYHK